MSASLRCPMPSAPPVEVERSCQDSQDYLAALLGLSSPESTARELEYAPLSPFSQDILYQLENDPSLFHIDQTYIPTPDPAPTSPDPPTSDDHFLRTSPTAHSQEPQRRVEYDPESGGDANSILRFKHKVGFVGVGERSGSQLGVDGTTGSPESQSRKRSAERLMGQRKKLAAGSIPLNSLRLKCQIGRVEELLKVHFYNFSRKVQESETFTRSEKAAHPDSNLKIVMVRSRHQAGAVVFRITDASGVLRLQGVQHLNDQYRFLLRYLNAHCEDSLKIQTVMEKEQLATLFGWIDEKIYGSGTGPALIGMSTSSELAWKKDDQFDNIQKKLITYFSQALTEREDCVPPLATCLVEEFKAQYERGISRSAAIPNWSGHSDKQSIGTTNFSMGDPFNLNQECKDLDPKVDIHASAIMGESQSTPKINYNQIMQHNSPPYNMQIVKDSLRNFSQANSEFKIQGKSGRITYPGLNIGMFKYLEEPSVKVFKVLNASKYCTMQKTPALISLHKCLLQKMYMHHNQLLHYSNIPELQHIDHHKRLLQWLEGKILGPSSGLPILGKRNSKRLVWDENDKYDAAQVVLICYLSRDVHKKDERAIKTAKILLELFLSQDKR
ncbi:hypothetical protein MJO28_009689 [Puccinia striiformis f. sp. tritici]|uniref:Uncharacterized protein n=1 Tax=Puccinia striiformis f. sp. tritici TaxID=168172 RepID=A0ACC0E8C0_9BASI|nr:hypothetical protein MJO28_009689 [Puccinia striiformis f. sp. tritici]